MQARSGFALAAVALLALASVVVADEPMGPPSLTATTSPHKKFRAVMDPATMTTTVFKLDESGMKTEAWAMYGFFRVAAIADDGEHLVTGYDGMNLLPVDHKKDEIMLRFFKRGELVRTVTLDRMIKDPTRLERTVSHVHWGNYVGFDAEGNYGVKTVEGNLAYDVASGRIAGSVTVKVTDPKAWLQVNGRIPFLCATWKVVATAGDEAGLRVVCTAVEQRKGTAYPMRVYDEAGTANMPATGFPLEKATLAVSANDPRGEGHADDVGSTVTITASLRDAKGTEVASATATATVTAAP